MRARTVFLVLVVAAAAWPRLSHLGAAGFAEDEIQKLRAIDGLRTGDLTRNAEHPLLMKGAMLGTSEAAGAWNGLARRIGAPVMSPEATLRAPNALAGAATTLLVFLLAESFFGPAVAALSACFWAFDVNAIAITRTGKEDALVLFFLLLAAWLYQRGKVAGARDVGSAQPWYLASAAAFGLMLASKYVPHLYGVHVLYLVAAERYSGANAPVKWRFYAAMAAAFLLANPVVLAPSTWMHMLSYAEGRTMTHTGYLFAGTLYPNVVSASPFGVPVWYYLTYLIAKVPLPVLVAFGAGLVPLVTRRQERGFVFLRVFLVTLLLGYSVIASKFVRYLLPVLAVLDITAAAGVVWLLGRLRGVSGVGRARLAASAALVVLVTVVPAVTCLRAAPFYSLALNPVGAALGPPGFLFPSDEFYDIGVREAVGVIAQVASPGATVASDAPGVVREYLDRAGRADLAAVSVSLEGLPMAGETWVIVQDGHTYFENQQVFEQLRARSRPAWSYVVRTARAVEVFRFPPAPTR